MIPKKSFELTPDDLREHPIWVSAMDLASPDDEDWGDEPNLVVPLPADISEQRRLFRDCNLWVRVEFAAACGRTFLGMIKLSDDGKVEHQSPDIVTRAGHVDFYHGIARPSPEYLRASYDRLGVSPDELFPLGYRPDSPVPYGELGGVLHGFYHLESQGRDSKIKYVR